MIPFVLYCKSYSTDLRRVVRLAQSVAQFNLEQIPFYVSVTEAELPLFRAHLIDLNVVLISDEDIVRATPNLTLQAVSAMPGHLAQQVIKSSFWHLNISNSYLCLDSDAFFIRRFSHSDFIAPNGTPYTMLDEAHDVQEDAMRKKRSRVITAFNNEADLVQNLFQRQGRRYSFGPFPLVWHRAVWESLDHQYLAPRNMNIADAILLAPIESRWYGEALLAFKAIDLMPCQALFKVYHYAWQKDNDLRAGVDHSSLALLYCGIINQSAWERELDWPKEGGNWLSIAGRRLRRRLGRI